MYKRQELERVAELCEISPLLRMHPYDLSGGEQQRAALAKVLLTRPRMLLLDEPTKGMDADFKERFAALLRKLREDGTTILLVSHDVEFCAEVADRCAMLFDGAVAACGTPRSFFAGNSFYTTAANRMARELLPEVVTTPELILAFGGEERECSCLLYTSIPLDDPRFTKGGGLLGNLLGYYREGAGFVHVDGTDGNDQMTTEQAFCALVAAERQSLGKCALYRMEDALFVPDGGTPGEGLPGKHPDVTRKMCIRDRPCSAF